MSAADWWAHTLGWGSIAALVCAAVLIAVEFAAPYAFLDDHPADIRERVPRPTPRRGSPSWRSWRWSSARCSRSSIWW